MNMNDPIDQDRMWFDAVEYGDQAQDAIDITDPFLASLAIIGELAGMGALHSIIDVLEDEVPNFDRDRVIEMNDDFAAHHAAWVAERYAALAKKVA
jgi:hypothetical protein